MERAKNTTQNCSAGATLEEVCLLLESDDALKSKQRENNQPVLPGVYNSTAQGFVEMNSQGPWSLFQTPSFGSQGSFLIQSLYLQLCGYFWGWELPPWSKPTMGMTGFLLGSSLLKENCWSVTPVLLKGSGPRMSNPIPHGSLVMGSLSTTGTENKKIILLQGCWLLTAESQQLQHPSLGPSQ